MKNLKLMLLTLSAIVFLGVGNLNAQEKKSETVIIRVFEFHRENKSKLVTTSPNGSTSSIELSNVNLNTFEGNDKNSIIMQSEIDNWKNQGFSIDGLTSLSNFNGGIITTIILSKIEE